MSFLRPVRSLVVAVLCLALTFLPATAMAGRPSYAASIQPLQYVDERGTHVFCTAFSINAREGYYGTARHCAEGLMEIREDGLKVMLGGAPVVVISIDPNYDQAVLQSPKKSPALKLFDGELQVGMQLEVYGYPYGLGPALTIGTLAAKNIPIEGYHVSNILDLTVAGGNSGSPVIRSGKLAGVLWGKFTESNHSLAVPHEATYWFFLPFTF